MALADLAIAGTDLFVVRRLSLGQDITDIIASLRNEFRTTPDRDLYAAYWRGLEAYRAGQRMDVMGPDERPFARDVPSPFPGRLGWHYGVLLQFGTPGTGVTEVRYFEIRWPTPLTRGEVEAMAAEDAEQWFSSEGRGRDSPPVSRRKQFMGARIIGVTRL